MILYGDLHGNCNGALDLLTPDALVKKYGEAVLKQKYLVILGDGGFLWKNSPYCARGGELLKAFDAMPWKTLCVAGNHENFEDIYSEDNLTTVDGQSFYQISEKVFYFKRYGCYTLENKKLLVLGGAASIDKAMRQEGVSWFPEECLSPDEQKDIVKNLCGSYEAVLAHTLPQSIARIHLNVSPLFHDDNSIFFEKLQQIISFNYWFCGHFHNNDEIIAGPRKYEVLYFNTILF